MLIFIFQQMLIIASLKPKTLKNNTLSLFIFLKKNKSKMTATFEVAVILPKTQVSF